MSVERATFADDGTDVEWTQLWTGLSRHKTFYAIPDAAEWEEMCGTGGRPWAGGIDLLS